MCSADVAGISIARSFDPLTDTETDTETTDRCRSGTQ